MGSTPAYREHYCANSALHGVRKPIVANIFRVRGIGRIECAYH
jgi:hypothetical protein